MGISHPRIACIRRTVVEVPLQRPILSVVRRADRVINILVELETGDGMSGVSYVAGFTRAKATAVCAMIDELGEVLAGHDVTAIGAAWDQMWRACTLAGHAGIAIFALSAIDIALWDLQGKLLGAPLHRLLGTRREQLPAYASDGCWLDDDPRRTAAEAAQFVAEGFRAVKIRFGRSEAEADLSALKEVRRAVGEDTAIMVDVNQGWTRARAQQYGRKLADLGVAWLEEPLPAEDIEGLAELRRSILVPVTAGESVYMPEGIRQLVEAQAVSVVMPDVQRVGGITGWLRANALAEVWQLPITSHLFPEISVHLLATGATAGSLEWVSWMSPLLEQPFKPREGIVEVPDRPGLGIRFDRDAVQAYRLD